MDTTSSLREECAWCLKWVEIKLVMGTYYYETHTRPYTDSICYGSNKAAKRHETYDQD